MGISLRDIIFEIGGGIPERPAHSRRCRPADRPAAASRKLFWTRRSIMKRSRKLGSIMGSGGMIVMDETSSMVDVARYFMEFCMTESCGKCIPCRAGTAQMHHLLGRFADREAHARRSGAARIAVRHGEEHQPVRAGPVRAQSRDQHAALFPA